MGFIIIFFSFEFFNLTFLSRIKFIFSSMIVYKTTFKSNKKISHTLPIGLS